MGALFFLLLILVPPFISMFIEVENDVNKSNNCVKPIIAFGFKFWLIAGILGLLMMVFIFIASQT